MVHEVFISYSRKDGKKAESLCTSLKKAGISHWIDRNIHGSANFLSEITSYIKNCKFVVFVASANSAKSRWTQREILYALKYQKDIVPYRIGDFRFEDNDELDFVFTNVQYVESEQAVVESLIKLGCKAKSTLASESNSVKKTRLVRVAKEFNVGLNTITDFLHRKGIEIDSAPNAPIDTDTYAIVEKEFGKYRNNGSCLGELYDKINKTQ